MEINRIWSMPNGKTFKMKTIREIICRHIKDSDIVLDPFANESSIKEYILPVVFDDSIVPGLDKLKFYLNANEHSPEEIAQFFIDKYESE